MDRRIKALRRITDAGHNIGRGKEASVPEALAQEWIRLKWAAPVAAPKPEKADK